ncbi:hypothetical protein BC940DRAFT_8524 [Gongronella butleri]|nr:hypothetical protein BC940DRAFT_8524 [Gongronella butleri]
MILFGFFFFFLHFSRYFFAFFCFVGRRVIFFRLSLHSLSILHPPSHINKARSLFCPVSKEIEARRVVCAAKSRRSHFFFSWVWPFLNENQFATFLIDPSCLCDKGKFG